MTKLSCCDLIFFIITFCTIMINKSKIFLLLWLFPVVIHSLLTHSCKTNDGNFGLCVNIHDCQQLIQLLKWKKLPEVFTYMRKNVCGFNGVDPKICCKYQNLKKNNDNSIDNNRFFFKPIVEPPTKSPKHRYFPIKDELYSSFDSNNDESDLQNSIYSISYFNHRNINLLDHENCGQVSSSFRIFGGTSATLGQFPWMALLGYTIQYSDGEAKEFRCGGTIVNERYVMTAAHCIVNRGIKLIMVRIGGYNTEDDANCKSNGTDEAEPLCAYSKPVDFEIEETLTHPGFSYATLSNDIALIRINGTMTFGTSANVGPICLPLDSRSREIGRSAVISGWGATEDGSTVSSTIRQLRLPILPFDDCSRAYRTEPLVKLSRDKQLCAGGVKGHDSCTGDSGGPLQSIGVYKGQARTIQHGIVSFGKRNCGMDGVPGIYTKVSEYVGWVLGNIKE